MAGITFPRDQIFRGWTEGETSRVVGEKDLSDKDIDKGIIQYHTSESREPYFYSRRLISQTNPARANRESQKTQRLVLIILASLAISVAVSVIVYWMTRPYFENAWKVCQSSAGNKEYVITKVIWEKEPFEYLWEVGKKISWPYKFIRYATADDLWYREPASFFSFLRYAFCLSLPFGGFFAGKAINKEEVNYEPEKIYKMVIDRSKDDRVCPTNFDIQKDCDPLTQEPISIQKLHSPQMIYLPNYVTDAKSFVSALLIAGKKDFSDPVSQREFTEEERKQILSQIKRIFLISKERFNECFDEPWMEWSFLRPGLYLKDKRPFDERREFSIMRSAQEGVDDYIRFCIDKTERFIDQIPDLQLRDRVRSFVQRKRNTIYTIPSSFNPVNPLCEKNKVYLSENDKAYLRVLQFENEAGVSLQKPQLQNEDRPVVCACADCSAFRAWVIAQIQQTIQQMILLFPPISDGKSGG